MLTTKNWRALLGLALAMLGAGLTACTPAGPRALLEGERLIREEKYPEAIRKLEKATKALPANAQAWNHLGLAYHKAGQVDAALKAYQQARQIDLNLTPVRYNLGCLYLEQGNPQAAIAELTAFTLLQRDSAQGLLKLATAQLRARQFDNAERSYQSALQLQSDSAEAWNGLGIIHLQRKHSKDALNAFNAALQRQPEYSPAILNLAVLNHYHLNNRPLALAKYQEFLELQPGSPESDSVTEAIRQLRAELTPAPRRDPTNLVSQTAPPAPLPNVEPVVPGSRIQTNTLVSRPPPSGSQPSTAPTTVARPKNLLTNTLATASLPPAPRTNPETPRRFESAPSPRTSPVQPASVVQVTPAATNQASPPTPAKIEVVQLADEPLPKVALDPTLPSATESPTLTNPQPVVESPRSPAATPAASPMTDRDTASEKRRVVDRLNPATWFRKRRVTTLTPLTPISEHRPDTHADPRLATSRLLLSPAPSTPPPPPIRRYHYQSPPKPAPGNRATAEPYFSRAVQAHRERRLPEAILEYRLAIAQDPSFYEAYYNLGLAAFDLKDLPVSLSAYETALSINATSADGRFNFALALERAGYYLDAAAEYEKLLEGNPDEARAHFALAGIYADQLAKPDLARTHYRRVLQLDPEHSQASEIRFWLAANP